MNRPFCVFSFVHETGCDDHTQGAMIFSAYTKNAHEHWAPARLMFIQSRKPDLALTSFKARILLVDDIYTTLAANHAVVTVTLGKCFQRILDFHCPKPRPFIRNKKRAGARKIRSGKYVQRNRLSTIKTQGNARFIGSFQLSLATDPTQRSDWEKMQQKPPEIITFNNPRHPSVALECKSQTFELFDSFKNTRQSNFRYVPFCLISW